MDESHIEAEHTSWPTVMGVLLLIAASGAVLCGLCSIGSTAFGNSLTARMLDVTPRPMPTIVTVVTVVDTVATLALAIMLIMGAIALLKRRARARTLLLRYAIARFAIAPVLLIGSLLVERPIWEYQVALQRDIIAKMEADGNGASVTQDLRDQANATSPPWYQRPLTLGFVALGLVVPAIVGIVMLRRPVRDEMARWQP